jgi:quinol monooxygenase YgiN
MIQNAEYWHYIGGLKMPKVGKLFTSGHWLVKAGKENEFISAWESFAQWTLQSQVGAGTGHLLQDSEDSRSFLSFGPWDNTEAIEQWRQEAEFQAFVGRARELCDEIQPRTLNLVALVPAKD